MDSEDVLKEGHEAGEKKSSKKKTLKYVIYILIVLIATGLSLWLSLRGDAPAYIDPDTGEEIVKSNVEVIFQSFMSSDWRIIVLIIGIVALSYVIDGFAIWVFCRLYTRKYKIHQGLATSLVGQFYSDLTPGASGGQVMQVYTMRSQGIVVSNAASIMVMWFILYQVALLLFDVVAFIVEAKSILALAPLDIWGLQIPMIPLIIIGFALNVSVIFLLFVMSFWKGFHNFILNHVINFLAKIRILKKPDETRENLRAQVENFKIELKRLSANIPVVILMVVMFFLMLFCRFCIPYFAGFALNAWDGYCTVSGSGCTSTPFSFEMMMHSAFLGAFHQMVTGLLPLPGSAGVSELFYNALFYNYFESYNGINVNNHYLSATISSTQILWRTATFHIPLVVSGLTAAFYRSRPKEPIHYANRKTFIALTVSTMSERKESADSMYETRQMSRKALQNRLNSFKNGQKQKNKENEDKPLPPSDDNQDVLMAKAKQRIQKEKDKEKKPAKEKKSKKNKKESDEEWESWTV